MSTPTLDVQLSIEQPPTANQRNQGMHEASRTCVAACFTVLLSACGGGGGSTPTVSMPPPPANYNLQAGMANMVSHGSSANVTLSGTAIVSGVSTAFTGSGTFSAQPATSATFNGIAALSQVTTVTGSVTVAGQTKAYSTSITDYHATSDGSYLGESSSGEYDVAQTPFLFPTMVVGGSSGILGTLSRYTDSTMSVSLGTEQLSYSVVAPANPGGPIGVAVTVKIYDTHSALLETDVTNYTMTSSNVISLSSATAQTQSGTLTVTAQ